MHILVNSGKGKTYSALKFITDLKKSQNYRIICNLKSFKRFSDTIYFSNIKDIMRYVNMNYKKEKLIIFYDEIFTILEKRAPISKELLSFISQLRKKEIILVTTAQEWSEINITFRRYCRYVIECNMFSIPFIRTAFIYNIINDGDKIKWDNDSQEFVAPRISANFGKCLKSVVDSYDTFEVINTF